MTAAPPSADMAALPPAAVRLLAEAGTALNRMRPEAAERLLANVLVLVPGCAEAHRLRGIAAQMRGEPLRAVGALRQALALRPDDAIIHMNLGGALFETGAADEALSTLQRACELAPGMAAAWYNLGKALKLQVRTEQACTALRQALRLDPSHVSARITLADALTSLGDIAAATSHYREILQRQPDNPKAWHALANLKTQPFDHADLHRLRHAFGRPGTATDARIMLGFALAKACDDLGDYTAAFEALREANALKRSHVAWDADAQRDRVDAIMAAFASSLPAPLEPDLGREVIFVVSLPRSGSTLVEQILASHPQIEGANEIPDLPQVIEDESRRRGQPFPRWVPTATAEDWLRLGHDYLARTARWRQRCPRFTDKNLTTWELVGAALAMLPGARVVNCRRDPVETCFACYRQLFSSGAHFSYDLDEMANHYRDYDRLSRYWRQRYPGRIFEQVHELLLADPETRIRRLLDFCGLDFHPACLDFHRTTRTVLSTASAAQVRQPLRRDTAHSVRYGDRLDALRARLHDIEPGYAGAD
jgi:tetratricopeptide (TPR) repeat protein